MNQPVSAKVEDFTGDSELIIGTIRGIRTWTTITSDKDDFYTNLNSLIRSTNQKFNMNMPEVEPFQKYERGKLYGASYSSEWVDGENISICRAQPEYLKDGYFAICDTNGAGLVNKAAMSQLPIDQTMIAVKTPTSKTPANHLPFGYGRYLPYLIPRVYYAYYEVGTKTQVDYTTALATKCELNTKKSADPKCTCGFWAYFDVNEEIEHRDVIGVIEGYGQVTVGSKGFRAEKAKILALAVRDLPSYKGLIFPSLVTLFMIALNLVIGISNLPTGVINLVAAAMVGIFFTLKILLPALKYIKNIRKDLRVLYSKLKENYPSVAVYDNQRKMFEDFSVNNPFDNTQEQNG